MEHLNIGLIFFVHLYITNVGYCRRIGKRRLGIDQTHGNILEEQRHRPGNHILLIRYIIGKNLLQMFLIDLLPQTIPRQRCNLGKGIFLLLGINSAETITKKFFVVIESKYGRRFTGTATRIGRSADIFR